MPYYDFECQDCKKITTIKLSVKEIENGIKIKCSSCNSYNTQRYFQPIAVSTSTSQKNSMGCGEHCRCFTDN